MKLNKILNNVLNMMRKGKELIYESELPRSVSGIATLLLQFTNCSPILHCSLFLKKSPFWNPKGFYL